MCYFEFTLDKEAAPVRSNVLRFAANHTLVITGFNTDIPHEGVTYHVQTEDKGLDTPLILSLVYVGGAIIASKRTRYDDLMESGFEEKVLTERLQRQHKLICAAIRAGRIEDLKRMGARDGPQTDESGAEKRDAPAADKNVEGKSEKRSSAKRAERAEASDDTNVTESVERNEGFSVLRQSPRVEILTNAMDEISAMSDDVVSHSNEVLRPERIAPLAHVEFSSEEVSTFEQAPVIHEAFVAPPSQPAMAGQTIGRNEEQNAEPEDLYLTLLDDEGDFRAGQLATVKVHVGRGAYGQSPVHDASVTVKVLGTSFRPLILATSTDERGIAVVRALLPRFTSGRAAIIIRAVASDDAAELRRIIHQA